MTARPDQPTQVSHRAPNRGAAVVGLPVAVGAAVAIALGVYGGLHEPTGIAVSIAGFSGAKSAKSWLATVAFLLALVQLVSALGMAGRLPGLALPWIPALHRWSGRVAVLITVPVMVHCLYALGFQSATPRVLIHSLLGCFFYGAFVAKMLLLTRRGLPRWTIPVIGGLVFTSLVGLWLTSSLWYFTTFGLTR
ncbi:MAG: DUF6529 family protein [Pseudonocardiaceae bacterium]